MDFNIGYKKAFIRPTLRHWLLSTKVRAYGSGRAAIVDIARYLGQIGIRRLWLPAWQCDELVISLKESGFVDIEFYTLTEDLLPEESFLTGLNPEHDAILMVDFFASVKGDGFNSVLKHFSGIVVLDAVHSWLAADLAPLVRKNVFIVSGVRKLFWKVAGALVTGDLASELPLRPRFIAEAAPNFPRNLSLAPRFGFFTKILLGLLNLKMFDQLAFSWSPQNNDRGIIEALKSPVRLVDRPSMPTTNQPINPSSNREWEWPHLYSGLPEKQKENALGLKNRFRVVFRNS